MDEELRADSIPDMVQHAYPQLTLSQWNRLTRDGRNRLSQGVGSIASMDLKTPAEVRWEYDELFREVMSNDDYKTPIGRLQRLPLDLATGCESLTPSVTIRRIRSITGSSFPTASSGGRRTTRWAALSPRCRSRRARPAS